MWIRLLKIDRPLLAYSRPRDASDGPLCAGSGLCKPKTILSVFAGNAAFHRQALSMLKPLNVLSEVPIVHLRTYRLQENNADKRMPAYVRQDRANRQHKSRGRMRFVYLDRLHSPLPQGGLLHETA